MSRLQEYLEKLLDGQAQGSMGKTMIREIETSAEFKQTSDESRGIIYEGKLYMVVYAGSYATHHDIIRYLIKQGIMPPKYESFNYNQSVKPFLPVQKFGGKLYVGESILDRDAHKGHPHYKERLQDIQAHMGSIPFNIPKVMRSI